MKNIWTRFLFPVSFFLLAKQALYFQLVRALHEWHVLLTFVLINANFELFQTVQAIGMKAMHHLLI
jgi:hypothetical protein